MPAVAAVGPAVKECLRVSVPHPSRGIAWQHFLYVPLPLRATAGFAFRNHGWVLLHYPRRARRHAAGKDRSRKPSWPNKNHRVRRRWSPAGGACYTSCWGCFSSAWASSGGAADPADDAVPDPGQLLFASPSPRSTSGCCSRLFGPMLARLAGAPRRAAASQGGGDDPVADRHRLEHLLRQPVAAAVDHADRARPDRGDGGAFRCARGCFKPSEAPPPEPVEPPAPPPGVSGP